MARRHVRPVDLFRAHAARAAEISALRLRIFELTRQQDADETAIAEFLRGCPGGVECGDTRYWLTPSGYQIATGPAPANAFDLDWSDPADPTPELDGDGLELAWPPKSLPVFAALAGPDAEPAPGHARLAEPDEIDRESA